MQRVRQILKESLQNSNTPDVSVMPIENLMSKYKSAYDELVNVIEDKYASPIRETSEKNDKLIVKFENGKTEMYQFADLGDDMLQVDIFNEKGDYIGNMKYNGWEWKNK